MTFNPDRHLDEPLSVEIRNLIVAKREAIARQGQSRRERIDRFHAIRRINESLQSLVTGLENSLRLKRRQVVADLEWNRLVHNREYAFVLHSACRLRELMTRITEPVAR